MVCRFLSVVGLALIAVGLSIMLSWPVDEKFVGLLLLAGGFALSALSAAAGRRHR